MSFVVHLCTEQRALPCSFSFERQCQSSPFLKAVSSPRRPRLSDFPLPITTPQLSSINPQRAYPGRRGWPKVKTLLKYPFPSKDQRGADVEIYQSPSPSTLTPQEPGIGGRKEAGVGLGLSERLFWGLCHIPHSGNVEGSRRKGFAPPFCFGGVLSAQLSHSPPRGIVAAHCPLWGRRRRERNAVRPPLPTWLTHAPSPLQTPQAEPAAGGLAARSPSRPGAPGAGAGSVDGAVRGETPAHTPLPGAGSAKPQTRSAVPGLGISSPAEREGRRGKDAKCAPARAREE